MARILRVEDLMAWGDKRAEDAMFLLVDDGEVTIGEDEIIKLTRKGRIHGAHLYSDFTDMEKIVLCEYLRNLFKEVESEDGII